MNFKAKIKLEGKTATGITVPQEIVDGLGSSKRPAVKVTINGYTYRSTISPYNGKNMLPISAENREGARVKANDLVDINVELDTEPRVVEVAGDIQNALNQDIKAKEFFNKLSNSHKRRYVLWIEGTKNPETRLRRIDKAISDLREGKK